MSYKGRTIGELYGWSIHKDDLKKEIKMEVEVTNKGTIDIYVDGWESFTVDQAIAFVKNIQELIPVAKQNIETNKSYELDRKKEELKRLQDEIAKIEGNM